MDYADQVSAMDFLIEASRKKWGTQDVYPYLIGAITVTLNQEQYDELMAVATKGIN